MHAVRYVLESFKTKLRNERIRWFTDNQTVVRIVQYGSSKLHLQAKALSIFCTCMNINIRIEPEWIPREDNELADYYSRMIDYDDWMLNPMVFQWLDSLWGPHCLDTFARPSNSQSECFNSRFWPPGTEAVAAFTCA